MGPPLEGWREHPRVNRHGEPADVEMLTQVVAKAPKWTFGIGRESVKPVPELDPASRTPGPGASGNADLAKYKKAPSYSLGARRERSRHPGMPLYGRPKEARAPLGKFPKTQRRSPFEPQPGPGPHLAPKVAPAGPKFSMGRPRVDRMSVNPSPDQYRPRPDVTQKAVQCGRWGPPSAAEPLRPQSAGPGPNLPHGSLGEGPKYSLGAKPVPGPAGYRRLGPPFTQFGYDDFGHSHQEEHVTYYFQGDKLNAASREPRGGKSARGPARQERQDAWARPGSAAAIRGAATARAPPGRPQSQQAPARFRQGAAERAGRSAVASPAEDEGWAAWQMLPYPM